MQFTGYTTSTLLNKKEEFEYTAQMCALERVEVPEVAAQEYLSIRDEIERRESLYETSCTSSNFSAALDVVMTAIGERSLDRLIAALAEGTEPWRQSAEVRINPKSGFFREILLRREPQDETDIVRAAIFMPGGPLPLLWVLETCLDLTVSKTIGPGEPLVYEVLRLVGEQSGRIEFVSNSLTYDPNALVTMIRVSCW